VRFAEEIELAVKRLTAVTMPMMTKTNVVEAWRAKLAKSPGNALRLPWLNRMGLETLEVGKGKVEIGKCACAQVMIAGMDLSAMFGSATMAPE
jgi:hypothetical protein